MLFFKNRMRGIKRCGSVNGRKHQAQVIEHAYDFPKRLDRLAKGGFPRGDVCKHAMKSTGAKLLLPPSTPKNVKILSQPCPGRDILRHLYVSKKGERNMGGCAIHLTACLRWRSVTQRDQLLCQSSPPYRLP